MATETSAWEIMPHTVHILPAYNPCCHHIVEMTMRRYTMTDSGHIAPELEDTTPLIVDDVAGAELRVLVDAAIPILRRIEELYLRWRAELEEQTNTAAEEAPTDAD